MGIPEIVTSFGNLLGAHLASDVPETTAGFPWAGEVAELVDRLPQLNRYSDYLEFLSHYGGAGLYRDDPTSDDYVLLLIYGFGEFADANEVDEDGYYPFAELQARYQPYQQGDNTYKGCFWRVFALDITGGREPAIYAPDASLPQYYQGRWQTFSGWLAEVVATQGKLPLH